MPELPKYFTISQDIISRIRAGELMPGMRVPSENQIIAEYRVSNTTARKALLEVERSGAAVRIKGKGTLVRSGPVVRSVTRILSFTQNMMEAGYTPSTKVLARGIQREGYSAVINGRRYTMPGPVCRIRRLRFGDHTPMLLEVRYISLRTCPGIGKKAFDRSLYELYEKDYGLRLTEVHQMVSAVMVDEETRRFFDARAPIPGFLVEGVTFCAKDIIVEMERSMYRGDVYRFAVRAI